MGNLYKYPRTPHLPWSEAIGDGDVLLSDINSFIGKEIVVTEKIDGENATIYKDYYHARSTSSVDHPSRHYIKRLQASIGSIIPEGIRICGENVFAKHSILYNSLPDYFLVFSIWDEERCFSWAETKSVCETLALSIVPELYRGIWDEKLVRSCFTGKSKFNAEQEGYVVRLASEFNLKDFQSSTAKFVRKNHIQTEDHWLNKEIIRNRRKLP